MNVPTKLDFAQEVRAERLSLLWKVTIILSLLLVWGALILTSLASVSPLSFFAPVAVIVIGCLLCRWLLMTNRYENAVWAYVIGLMIGIGVLMFAPAAAVEPPRRGVTYWSLSSRSSS